MGGSQRRKDEKKSAEKKEKGGDKEKKTEKKEIHAQKDENLLWTLHFSKKKGLWFYFNVETEDKVEPQTPTQPAFGAENANFG